MRAEPLTFQRPERLDEVQPFYLRHVRNPESQELSFCQDIVWLNSLPASIFSFELVSREEFLYKLLPEEGRSIVEPTALECPILCTKDYVSASAGSGVVARLSSAA